MTRSILLIDDDPEVLSMLERFFERKGWVVSRAEGGEAGLGLYDRERPDVVLLDLELPDLTGLQVLQRLRGRDPDAVVMMLTGRGSIASAVEAMRLGAENFLTKPVELAHLEAAAERALEKVKLRQRNRFFVERQAESSELTTLGQSPAVRDVAQKLELLAAGDATVLLLGESGTGKGWGAQLLHKLSPRAEAPFIEVNCAGLTATFLESELFGHERGAFTDAKAQKPGLFEIADGGTLFLDEIGDLALELQPKLLKVIESRRFRRLGGTREIEVDVRIVAATNHELESAVKAGKFREDLYYRLAVLPIRMPPLRVRGADDIAELSVRFLEELRRRIGRGPTRFSPEALELLCRYGWPGNIRELRNVLERVLLLAARDEEVRPEHLPQELIGAELDAGVPSDAPLSLAEVERLHILRMLERNDGNRSATARALGISRATLYHKLKQYDM